jgi:L-histidine Nalpha-methyltransferase / hercynylcysteine S-oxide synthase
MPSTDIFYEARPLTPGLKAVPKSLKSDSGLDIIDIRQTTVEFNLKQEIHSQFRPSEGPRQLPTLLLYDEKGLQLFEQVPPLPPPLHVTQP